MFALSLEWKAAITFLFHFVKERCIALSVVFDVNKGCAFLASFDLLTPLVSFHMEDKSGNTFPFQITSIAAGGSLLETERIARLCWVKLKNGAKKDAVTDYRNSLYKKKRAAEDADDDGQAAMKKARN